MLQFVANIYGDSGYAIHAREFVRALSRIIPVGIIPLMGTTNKDHHIPDIEQLILNSDAISPEVTTIVLDMPKSINVLGSGRNIAYVVFEQNKFSDALIDKLAQFSEIWVPSRWAAEVLQQYGLYKVAVVHEGVDPKQFYPSKKIINDGIYRFVSVGKWETRKGIKELIAAFGEAFHAQDRVELHLHLYSEARNLAGVNIEHEVAKLNFPYPEKLKVSIQRFEGDTALREFYHQADCYVSSSKAEGWGLPIIEAMACGLPVIAANYSAPSEYLNAANSYLYDVQQEAIYCPYFFPEAGQMGTWAKIDVDVLARQLKYVYEHQSEAAQKGIQASRDVTQNFTWDQAAGQALQLLQIRRR